MRKIVFIRKKPNSPDTLPVFELSNSLCDRCKNQNLTNTLTNQRIIHSGREYVIYDIPVMSCSVCDLLIFNEQSKIYINDQLSLAIRRKRIKAELMDSLCTIPLNSKYKD